MKHALVFLGSLSLLAGCSGNTVRPEGAQVIISAEHVHSRYCGHYFFDGHWYYLPQHKHGVDCGHEFVDGVWVLED